jgi:hypothetical protein
MNHREMKNEEIADFINKVMTAVADAFTEGNFRTRYYVTLAHALRSTIGFAAMQTISDEAKPEMAKEIRQSIFNYLTQTDREAMSVELKALNSTQH